MGLRALGDSAWLFKSGIGDPQRSFELIMRLRRLINRNRIPEITDIVSSFDTIAVHFNPADGETVFAHLTSLNLGDVHDEEPMRSFTITVPVIYGGTHGPDLKPLADALGLSPNELIDLHSETEYNVAAIGFAPGFPYLTGLPKQLHHPRHATPRKVPAGSVAIAGDQAGIYPSASQGGWHIIGQTNLTLFDPNREDPSLLHPGDKLRFIPVDRLEQQMTPSPEASEHPHGGIRVIEPGALTSIQDPGRLGYQHLGASPGGAVDSVSAAIANRLVGNSDDAAVIECTMTGPKLQFDIETTIAWVGWANEASGKPVPLKAGARVDLTGRMTHLRGYIAVAGGIDVPMVMGSRATDLRAGFGGFMGRALSAGDSLPVGVTDGTPNAGTWRVRWPGPSNQPIELRYTRGMQADWFSPTALQLLSNTFYQISPSSDRMGTRLTGSHLELNEPREMVSQPVVAGSIQVPPDGQPIVLMGERQSIGGYPQIGHVISADLPLLARAWPGTQVHFREVSLDEARDAWVHLQGELGLLQAGLNLQS